MTAWERYKEENVVDRCHKDYPGWEVDGAWTFRRMSDGAITHHKADTPYGFWERACEESLAIWESVYPNPVPPEQQLEAYDLLSQLMAKEVANRGGLTSTQPPVESSGCMTGSVGFQGVSGPDDKSVPLEDLFPDTPQNRLILAMLTQKFCRILDSGLITQIRDTFGSRPDVVMVCNAISEGLAAMAEEAASKGKLAISKPSATSN